MQKYEKITGARLTIAKILYLCTQISVAGYEDVAIQRVYWNH